MVIHSIEYSKHGHFFYFFFFGGGYNEEGVASLGVVTVALLLLGTAYSL